MNYSVAALTIALDASRCKTKALNGHLVPHRVHCPTISPTPEYAAYPGRDIPLQNDPGASSILLQ
ncbi:MAG: hypothetical protein V2B20_15525 [Pseudomonadota bacterium]